jgi:hypothetical protein
VLVDVKIRKEKILSFLHGCVELDPLHKYHQLLPHADETTSPTCLFRDLDNRSDPIPEETSQFHTASMLSLAGAKRLTTSSPLRCFP